MAFNRVGLLTGDGRLFGVDRCNQSDTRTAIVQYNTTVDQLIESAKAIGISLGQ